MKLSKFSILCGLPFLLLVGCSKNHDAERLTITKSMSKAAFINDVNELRTNRLKMTRADISTQESSFRRSFLGEYAPANEIDRTVTSHETVNVYDNDVTTFSATITDVVEGIISYTTKTDLKMIRWFDEAFFYQWEERQIKTANTPSTTGEKIPIYEVSVDESMHLVPASLLDSLIDFVENNEQGSYGLNSKGEVVAHLLAQQNLGVLPVEATNIDVPLFFEIELAICFSDDAVYMIQNTMNLLATMAPNGDAIDEPFLLYSQQTKQKLEKIDNGNYDHSKLPVISELEPSEVK